MAAKHALQLDKVSPSERSKTSDGCTVHGVLTELSPVKVSKKNSQVQYFTGKITDGKKTMRMVSFDPKLRVRLDSFCKDETPVAISDCTVKAADAGAGFELIASPRRSNVTKSAKTFDGFEGHRLGYCKNGSCRRPARSGSESASNSNS